MKKYIAVLITLFGLFQTTNAQSHLDVKVTKNVSIDAVTVVFENGTSEDYFLGQQGIYSFDFEMDIDYLVYYETICAIGETVRITNGQVSYTATLQEEGIQDESRSFTSIIR